MNTITKLEIVREDVKQVAREIYYAMSFMPNTNCGIANLKRALDILGVNSPEDVNLRNSVLNKK